MWQSLFEAHRDQGFVVLAVALDDAPAARPWIEAAAPSYPCLIDPTHRLADLYGFTNVPQAVWIDEDGTIVRLPETAGSTDAFRQMNRETGTLPDAVAAERQRVKAQYLEAVGDWARHGRRSAHALPRDEVLARLHAPADTVAEAHAHFRLGRWLVQHGRGDEAAVHLDTAARLHPESWAMWRQAAAKNERGLAAGPAFWSRVDALGDRPYYPPARL